MREFGNNLCRKFLFETIKNNVCVYVFVFTSKIMRVYVCVCVLVFVFLCVPVVDRHAGCRNPRKGEGGHGEGGVRECGIHRMRISLGS